jgi:putative transcriptional regulator
MIAPAKGVFLLAGGGLLDPNFVRSVVLLCDHSEEGSFGLILNQPMSLKLSDGFPSLDGWDAPLYKGGPVQSGALNFIHTRGDIRVGSQEVLPGVYWGGDFDAVNKLMREKRVLPEEFRFFAGYSGWGKGQLQGEVDRKDWYLTHATSEMVFFADPKEQWRSILRVMGREYAIYANLPINPQLN